MRRIAAALAVVVALLFSAGSAWADSDDYLAAQAARLQEWRALAEQGDPVAQFDLGTLYRAGYGQVVPQNDAEAMKWFRKSAEQGLAKAQFFVGFMYDNGMGVPKNDAEAVKWYRKAAEQGHEYSQLSLGRMYWKGKGVPVNYVKAYMWWSLATAQGVESTADSLEFLSKQMTHDQIAKAQELAAEWWKKHND